jgi:hypothetical protein
MSNSLIYKVDHDDVVSEVSSGWDDFARLNNGIEACREYIIGRPIYNCIAGSEVESFYQQVFDKTRSSGVPISVPFRCDSPSDKRFLNLTVTDYGKGVLECNSKTLAVVPRAEPIEVMLVSGGVSAAALYMCGVCKAVHLRANLWRELDTVSSLIDPGSLRKRPFVQTICPSCAERTVACDYLVSAPADIGRSNGGVPLVVVLRPLDDYWTFQFTHPEVQLNQEFFVLSPFLWETIGDPISYVLERLQQTIEAHNLNGEAVTILAFEQASSLACSILEQLPGRVAKIVFVNPCGAIPVGESNGLSSPYQDNNSIPTEIRIVYESGVAPGLHNPWEYQSKDSPFLKRAKEYHFVSRLSYSLPTLAQVGVL